jgi:hypothetical protein
MLAHGMLRSASEPGSVDKVGRNLQDSIQLNLGVLLCFLLIRGVKDLEAEFDCTFWSAQIRVVDLPDR